MNKIQNKSYVNKQGWKYGTENAKKRKVGRKKIGKAKAYNK